MGDIKIVEKVHACCEKVLPLVYDESLSYYEVLCKVMEMVNNLVEVNNGLEEYVNEVVGKYVEEWFKNYPIASETQIGSVLSGGDISVDSATGAVSVLNANNANSYGGVPYGEFAESYDNVVRNVSDLQGAVEDIKNGETVIPIYERTLLSEQSGELVTIEPSYEGAAEVAGLVHNLIPYPYNETSKTINGITFTVNNDGTIIVNGTATANAELILQSSTVFGVLPQGEYILNGCPSGGGINSWYLRTGGEIGTVLDVGSGVVISSDGTKTCGFVIRIVSGAIANNIIFKPMLAKGTTPQPFIPYAGYEVKSCGKNLAHTIEIYNFSMYYGISASIEVGESEFLISGTSTEALAFRIMKFTLPQGTYTASVHGLTDNGVTRLYLANVDDNTVIINNIMPNAQKKFTISEETTIAVHCVLSNNDTYVNKTICVQVERGAEATEYEPYTEDTQTVTPSTDKLYLKTYEDTTNIFTDYGVEIDVSYGATKTGAKVYMGDYALQELKKTQSSVENNTNAIISLGGNI